MVSRAPWRDWASPLGQGDPLAGRLYDTATRGIVVPAALLRRASSADFVLLGEKHDNPDHHRLQAWLLSSLVREGRHRSVAFEMLTQAQEAALAEQRKKAPEDVMAFAEAVDWEGSGAGRGSACTGRSSRSPRSTTCRSTAASSPTATSRCSACAAWPASPNSCARGSRSSHRCRPR